MQEGADGRGCLAKGRAGCCAGPKLEHWQNSRGRAKNSSGKGTTARREIKQTLSVIDFLVSQGVWGRQVCMRSGKTRERFGKSDGKTEQDFQAMRCGVPLAGDSLLVMGFSSCMGASSQG